MDKRANITNSLIEKTIGALKNNEFEVWYVENRYKAEEVFWKEIFAKSKYSTVSWGDSLTLHATRILSKLKDRDDVLLIETFGEHFTREERMSNRRKALLSDLFLTGTNAVTSSGQLINLDMVGNRVGGITFGPQNVVIFVGVNKIVESIDDGMKRVKDIAAPLNAKRHSEFKMPCQVTGECMDCNSPDRICNVWTITEKSYPKGRIKVILIDEELGL